MDTPKEINNTDNNKIVHESVFLSNGANSHIAAPNTGCTGDLSLGLPPHGFRKPRHRDDRNVSEGGGGKQECARPTADGLSSRHRDHRLTDKRLLTGH